MPQTAHVLGLSRLRVAADGDVDERQAVQLCYGRGACGWQQQRGHFQVQTAVARRQAQPVAELIPEAAEPSVPKLLNLGGK